LNRVQYRAEEILAKHMFFKMTDGETSNWRRRRQNSQYKITAVVCMSTNKDEDNANGVAYSNIMTRMRQDACFTAWGKNNR